MRRTFALRPAAAAVWALAAAGCTRLAAPPALAPRDVTIDERRAMQSREWAAPPDAVFAATIAVVQDLGWNLDAADRGAGILRASTARKPDAFGPEDETRLDLRERIRTARQRSDASRKWSRWREMVVHVEPWGAGRSRQRIVMNLRGSLPAMSYAEREGGGWLSRGRELLIHAPAIEQSVEVLMPEAYEDLFNRIAAAVSQRTTVGGPP